MSSKERFLTMHRATVRDGIRGRLSVMQTLLALCAVDLIYVPILIYCNITYIREFKVDPFSVHCYLHIALTVLSYISFIPGTIWLYLSLPIHFLRIAQVPYVVGVIIGRIYIYGVHNASGTLMDLLNHYVNVIGKNLLGLLLFLICVKPFFNMVIVWYVLVLERIRSVNGTGWEKKSAMDLEMEALTSRSQQTPMEVNLEN
ncbi:hypothetical protein BgAZ_105920 [Babesia gibsoni]|uniref:Uncharacterized protein n=1 Tax=Babesia gibsoni TaxID=33632 RepID=A0AAD8UTH0_BABGI|nr:hypothetical protein BgAZ_105920 [Babesia gibsoni]